MTTQTSTSSAVVDVGDGLEVPAEVTVTDDDVNGYEVTVTAVYREASGRYEARELTVRGRDGAEVTGKELRNVPVASILRAGLEGALADLRAPLFSAGLAPEQLRDAGIDHMCRWVARRYRLALLVGDAPTQAIAKEIDVTRSTAGRWVTRARDRGLLTVQDKRGGPRG